MMNKCEAEIDAIRLQLYEETKNLTREEDNKRLKDLVKKLAKEHGITVISSANNNKREAG